MKKLNRNSFEKYIKINKENRIESNNAQGITLIALIVTIVVMIVIAGVTINMTIGENGIFTKAVKAKEMQEAAEVKERLELKQLDARLALGGENMTLENYLKYLVDQGMIDESDIEDTEDSNVKTILVDDKYMYTVVKKDDGTIELEYEGKAGKLLPKIKSVNTKSTTSSIEVKVDATRVDKGEYRFYIKDVASGEEYKKKGTNKTGEYTFTGLEQNKEFKVKVEVENKNGIAEKETSIIRTVTVAELTQSDLEFTYNPNDWTKDKIVVTVNAKIELPEGYTLQTSKDMTNWENTTTQEFAENGYMYVRLFDGINGGNYAVGEVSKIDKDAPTALNINVLDTTVKSISISVSATDVGGSGIKDYRFSKDNGNTWTEYQKSGEYTFNGLYDIEEKTYNIQVEVRDNALNSKTATTSVTTKKNGTYYVNKTDLKLFHVDVLNTDGTTLWNRDFYKANEGASISSIIYSNCWKTEIYLAPLLISTNKDAVEYYTTYDYAKIPYWDEISYKGIKFYYSGGGQWVEGNGAEYSQNIIPAINKLEEPFQTMEEAAKKLLDLYFEE